MNDNPGETPNPLAQGSNGDKNGANQTTVPVGSNAEPTPISNTVTPEVTPATEMRPSFVM